MMFVILRQSQHNLVPKVRLLCHIEIRHLRLLRFVPMHVKPSPTGVYKQDGMLQYVFDDSYLPTCLGKHSIQKLHVGCHNEHSSNSHVKGTPDASALDIV